MFIPGLTLEDMLPKFAVVSPEFLPVCAHPDEDAGADLKLYIPQGQEEYPSNIKAFMYDSANKLENRYLVILDGKETPINELRDFVRGQKIISIQPGETAVLSTGFRIAIPCFKKFGPYKGVYKIVSRSGLAIKHKIRVANSPGIIDKGYRDFVKVGLTNESNMVHVFTEGSRIAQGIYEVVFDQASYSTEQVIISDEEFDALESARGKGGLGSTKV